jgi:hypothetical protein
VSASKVTVHVDADPEHAPVHPAKPFCPVGFSVSVTEVPATKSFEHVVGHEIPDPDTVPAPSPPVVTLSVCVAVGVHASVTAPVPPEP